ncbi:MAG TPA: TonB-dependent receptor plug domain-containing protein, partial [Acidobacteriota bacterium]
TADRFEEPLENTGSTVSIITRQEIEERKSPFVLDLLRTVPGLYIAQGGSPGKITSLFTRGAGSDQTLVTIDGIQINDSTGFIDLANLATTNIERIEIVRAPQSTLYGSDALGGVINIITRGAGPLFSARGEFGSDATWNGNARAAFGSDVNHLAFEYSRFMTDGETSNDDFDNKTVAANSRFQLTDWTQAGIIYRHVDSDLGIPFLSGASTADQRQTSESNLVHIPIKQKVLENWDAAFHFSIFDQELHFRHPTNPFGLTFSDTDSRTTTYHFLNTVSIQEHTLIAGFEHEKIAINDQSSFGVSLDEAEVSSNAFYAQMQLAAWESLMVTLGIRIDDH